MGADRSPGMLPDEVNRLLDKWTIGHVLIIRKRFLESKPSKSNDIDLIGFRAMFSELDQVLPLPAVASAFKIFDSNQTGCLTFRDICVGLATCCLGSWEIRSRFLFHWFDMDRDDSLNRREMELLLTCVAAAVHRAVESGDWSARFPFMSPSAREGLSLAIQARGLSPLLSEGDRLERGQSCVTAVQSEVYSAIEDRRSVVYDHSSEFVPSENEMSWIESELNNMILPLSSDQFTDWSVRNSHYLYKLLELFEIVPSPDREKRACMAILRRCQLEPGSEWFVVSYKWIQLWRSYVRWTEADNANTAWTMTSLASPSSSMEVQQALSMVDMISCTSSVLQQRLSERPPAINNSDLEGELKGALKANLVEHHDYVLVPVDMWKLLVDWYGGGPAFPRKVTNTLPKRKLSTLSSLRLGSASFTSVELYPPLILVLVCGDRGVPIKHFTKRFFVSRSDTCMELRDQLVRRLVSAAPDSCRLWHRRSGERWELIQVDDPRRIDDFVDYISTDAGAFMIEPSGAHGKYPRDSVPAEQLDEDGELQVGDRVDATRPGDNCGWRSATIVDLTNDRIKVHFDGEQYKEDAWLGLDEIAPLGSHSDASLKKKASKNWWSKIRKSEKIIPCSPKRPVGIGLENIGNTCFMNATLQCLSYTPMLKSFFLSQSSSIPTGNLAGEFASLLSEMWNSKKRTLAPKAFKKALDKFAPSFAGYEHQDAHELLALLLDGLHEDLNRGAAPKPTEASDSRKPGTEAWKKHKSEHASIIADLFDGQQRVQTVCKTCGHSSDIYEAFRYVMVPVPVTDDHRTISIYLLPISGPKVFQLSVSVHKASTFNSVVQTLSSTYATLTEELSLDWEAGIVAAEIYLSRLHRFIDGSCPISDFRSDDRIFVFQTPNVGRSLIMHSRSRTVSDVTRSQENLRMLASSIDSPPDPIVLGAVGSCAVRLGSPVRPRLGSATEDVSECYAQIVHRREYVSRRQRRTVTRKEIFGTPCVMACSSAWTYGQLHAAVVAHVSRFSRDGSGFAVHITSPDGSTCSACGKLTCEGCRVLANSVKKIRVNGNWVFLAVDWLSADKYQDLGISTLESLKQPTYRGMPRKIPGVVSLYDCMDAYTAREHLAGENQWFCDQCKTKRDAERSTSWWFAPDVLVVLLKRFQFTHAGMEKIDVPIDFPVSDFTLKSGTHPTCVYDLYGIVNHTGSLSSGHYTATCRTESDSWSVFNDHRVTPVKAGFSECARSSYVLFYKRKDTRTANLINYAPQIDV